MKYCIGLLFFICLSCSPASHQQLTPSPNQKHTDRSINYEAYLRKLSFHLRGHPPRVSEYTELQRIEGEDLKNKFTDRKIDEYLSSYHFVDKMELRFEELLSMRASQSSRHPHYKFEEIPEIYDSPHAAFSTFNSMNHLIRSVFQENLSWDELLTSRRFRLFPIRDKVERVSDHEFFAGLVNEVIEQKHEITDLEFDNTEDRIAGILTTNRFVQRYTNTNLNRGRRWASVVFKVFLCDEMRTVVVNESSNQSAVLDLVFPGQHHSGAEMDPLQDVAMGTQQTNESCMACHQKLDPVGRTYSKIGSILSSFKSPGQLVYERTDGSLFREDVRSIGDLGRKITEQQLYVDCQTKRMWDWFIGTDMVFNESIQRDISKEVEHLNRKPKSFIKYLVSRSEFYQGPESSIDLPTMVANVKAILNNCTSCHQSEGIPDFTNWPIGGSDLSHQRYLTKIQSDMGLSGTARSMPPLNSGWQPSDADLDLLKHWYEQGAPDEEGRTYVD